MDYARFRALEVGEAPAVRPRPVFGHDAEYTVGLLEPVFRCCGDYERLSGGLEKRFLKGLDSFWMSTSDVDEMLNVCNEITKECTGRDFQAWRFSQVALEELRKAWLHFGKLLEVGGVDWEKVKQRLGVPIFKIFQL